MSGNNSPDPLRELQAALVLLIAAIVGLVGGGLSYLSTHDTPGAVLVGGAAAGGTIALFYKRPSRR